MVGVEKETQDTSDRIVLRLRTRSLVPQKTCHDCAGEGYMSLTRVPRVGHTDISGAGAHLGGACELCWKRFRKFIAAGVNHNS